jgi:hypothetical protein
MLLVSLFLPQASDVANDEKPQRFAILLHASEVIYWNNSDDKRPFGGDILWTRPRRPQQRDVEAAQVQAQDRELQERQSSSLWLVVLYRRVRRVQPIVPLRQTALEAAIRHPEGAFNGPSPPMVNLGSIPGPPDPVHARYGDPFAQVFRLDNEPQNTGRRKS